MSLRSLLLSARRRLNDAGIDDAALEAEVLLRHVCGLDRAGLLQRLDQEPTPEQEQRFHTYVERRLCREPSAYITGHREFYGLDFLVTPATLIPRPETETLVEAAVELLASARTAAGARPGHDSPVIVDVGTGSGAIAVSLARTCPNALLYATDTSSLALTVARHNAGRLAVERRIVFGRGNLLEPVTAYVELIVANLPYVRSGDLPGLQPEVRDYEPLSALDGGPDGLDCIRRLLRQAPRYLRPHGAIALEFGDGQEQELSLLASRLLPAYEVEVRNDLAGRPRVFVARHAAIA